MCNEFFVVIVCNFRCRLDDMMDNSFLHGGIPAAHTLYGVASTISAAICVYFKSMRRVFSSNHPDMIKLYTETILEFWQGQTMEIYWRDTYTCPSEEQYLEMVSRSKYMFRVMSRV